MLSFESYTHDCMIRSVGIHRLPLTEISRKSRVHIVTVQGELTRNVLTLYSQFSSFSPSPVVATTITKRHHFPQTKSTKPFANKTTIAASSVKDKVSHTNSA